MIILLLRRWFFSCVISTGSSNACRWSCVINSEWWSECCCTTSFSPAGKYKWPLQTSPKGRLCNTPTKKKSLIIGVFISPLLGRGFRGGFQSPGFICLSAFEKRCTSSLHYQCSALAHWAITATFRTVNRIRTGAFLLLFQLSYSDAIGKGNRTPDTQCIEGSAHWCNSIQIATASAL